MQRPTAMLFHDPLFGHHRPWMEWLTGIPHETDPELADVWTDWDFILADVEQTISDYTDPESGQYMPYDQSGEVDWDVRVKVSGAKKALDAAYKRNPPKDGESYYAVPTFRDPENKPTLESWAKDMEEGKADGRPPEARDARPPSPAELAEFLARKKREKAEKAAVD